MIIIRALVLMLAAALILAGCNGPSPKAEDVPTLRRGLSARVSTLDPHKSSAQWENIVIGDLFVGLMTDGPDGRPQPGMATSYTVDDTGRIWTFKLGDYVWSDGKPVVAGDFVYAFRRIQDPAIASQYAALMWVLKNAERVNAGTLPPEELGARAIDDKTLELTLEYPAPYLPGLLTHYSSFPVPQHAVEAHGEAWIQPQNIVVNGPYKLVYWRTGDQLASDRNPTGFAADTLCFDRVIYFELEDLTAVENKIMAGELDTAVGFDGPRRKELDRKLPGWPRSAPALWTNYWSFNTRIAPFDDIRVRKALAISLDRDFMVRSVLTPGVEPAYAFVPPGMDNYKVDRPQVPWADQPIEARRAEARRLLEEAGFGPQKPLEFEYIHRSTDDNPKVAPVAQDHWSRIAPWVKPTIIKQETATFYQRMRQADFEVGDGAWVADFDDPINYLFLLESATGQQNYAGYDNAEYDALLVKGKAEPDLAKRAVIFAEAERVMLEDYPITPMWYSVTKNLVNPELTGWIDNAKDVNRSRYLCRKGATRADGKT